jgi:hypothetical protein
MKKEYNGQMRRPVGFDQRTHIFFKAKIIAPFPSRRGFEGILSINYQQSGLCDWDLVGIQHDFSSSENTMLHGFQAEELTRS